MERKERIRSFLWNLLALLGLFLVIFFVSDLSQRLFSFQHGLTLELYWYLFYVSLILGGFISALIMKADKIKTLLHQRQNFTIRKEWIVLSIFSLFLACMKFWLPNTLDLIMLEAPSPRLFHILLTGYWGDIVLAFTSGLFLVGIFHISKGNLITQKEKALWLIWNLFAILCVLITVYCLYKYDHYLLDANGISESRFYNSVMAQIAGAFICTLLLQGEQIVNMIRNRQRLLFRWELFLLAAIACFFASMHFWLFDFLKAIGLFPFGPGPSIGDIIMAYLLRNNFSVIVFACAATVLLLLAFHIKGEKDYVDGLSNQLIGSIHESDR